MHDEALRERLWQFGAEGAQRVTEVFIGFSGEDDKERGGFVFYRVCKVYINTRGNNNIHARGIIHIYIYIY